MVKLEWDTRSYRVKCEHYPRITNLRAIKFWEDGARVTPIRRGCVAEIIGQNSSITGRVGSDLRGI